MPRAYVQALARTAYVWGWPLVNSHNRRAAFAKAPEPGRNAGVLPVAPTGRIAMLSDYIKPNQNFVACSNQDVVYGRSEERRVGKECRSRRRPEHKKKHKQIRAQQRT